MRPCRLAPNLGNGILLDLRLRGPGTECESAKSQLNRYCGETHNSYFDAESRERDRLRRY